MHLSIKRPIRVYSFHHEMSHWNYCQSETSFLHAYRQTETNPTVPEVWHPVTYCNIMEYLYCIYNQTLIVNYYLIYCNDSTCFGPRKNHHFRWNIIHNKMVKLNCMIIYNKMLKLIKQITHRSKIITVYIISNAYVIRY